MVKTGIVKEKEGERLRVCFERPDSCAGCRGCINGLTRKKDWMVVFGDAQVGDIVEVRLPEARLLKATLLVYGVPMCLLLLGLAIGSLLKLSEGLTLLSALLGMAIGFLLVRLVEKRLRALPQWRPTVISSRPGMNDQTEGKKE